MATLAQILANQANAQKSHGPSSETGKAASSQNAVKHGLCAKYHNGEIYFLPDEDKEKYDELSASLVKEHKPETETEHILVANMARHEWLRGRALRLQEACFMDNQHMWVLEHFKTYIRYETTHERGFLRCLNELRKLRKEMGKQGIGFVRKETTDGHATCIIQLQKIVVQQQKAIDELKKSAADSQNTPEVTPEGVKNAA